MNEVSIKSQVVNLNHDDKCNLMALLGDDSNTAPEISDIENLFKELFHSRTRAVAESSLKNIGSWAFSKVISQRPEYIETEDLMTVPTYSDLLIGACEHLKVAKGNNNITQEKAELYISHAVIVGALSKMSPDQRIEFFNREVSIDDAASHTKEQSMLGPMTTIAALGAANATGFGVYMASTTALGFVTHAVGVTLPFAVYTGLTSTIAVVIGPIGWLSAGLWGAWRLTSPEWKKIVSGLIYLIAVNSAKELPKFSDDSAETKVEL